ncbi:MAG TPA: ROK family protein [Thermoleophilaceae bacterium]
MESPTPPPSGNSDFVLAIDFGGTKIALATADVEGHILEADRLDTNAGDGAAQAIDRALGRAAALVAATAGQCLAVGAVSPGIVYPDRVWLAPNVPGWEGLALAQLLRESLGVARVELANDAKAAALAETRWGSLRGFDPAVLLNLGTGLSAGIVVGGDILEGANGAAGEIGYNLRGLADERGAADGRAPLEEFAGGRAIGERGSRLLGETFRAADVFAHGDVRARLLIDEALAELSLHVANLAILLNPARIAVGGGLMSHADLVLAALERRISFAVPFPPELVPAQFLHDGPLRGAVALALEAARGEAATDTDLLNARATS